jgi:lysozyme
VATHIYRCVCGKIYRYGTWIYENETEQGIVYWLDDCGCYMIYKVRGMLIRHEGKRNKKYRCSKGHWSIGIGHNIDALGLPKDIKAYLDEHGRITDEMIKRLFAADVMDAVTACMKLYPQFNTFSEARRLALVDFLFNVGIGTAQQFVNTNRAVNGGDWTAAAEGIRTSLYWKQLGGDPPGTDDGKLERPEEIYKMIREG